MQMMMDDLVNESDLAMAPCLNDGPIAMNGRALVAASRMLGSSSSASLLRAWCVPSLFQGLEAIVASGQEPINAINKSIGELAQMLYAAGHCGIIDESESNDESLSGKVEDVTGNHYGRLFEAFDSKSYWEEPARLLSERLERNGIPLSSLHGKDVLDAGCGGGRYTVAWALVGARSAVGCDVSETGLADAKRRACQAAVARVSFEQGNVLALPFPADRFDIAFSNGVLHHTVDWARGVKELVRVLKPNGLGWVYLIENPGGLFWDVIEILRVVMKNEKRERARDALRLISIPPNRIFYMLDHVMVPINVRLTPREVENRLREAGATRIRRLARGTDFDRIEHIYRDSPYAKVHFGVGENRYIFSKN